MKKSISLDPKVLGTADSYKILIGSIVPRPIAWVSTVDSHGRTNLAPFSFFNGVSSNPPALMISIARKPDGSKKDTLNNVEKTGEFVVNIPSLPLAEKLNLTSKALPPDESEFDLAELTEVPSQKVKPPRVGETLIQMECTLLSTTEVGSGAAGSSTVIIGEVVQFHLDPSVYENGKINLSALQPFGRLAGADYCELGRVFRFERPS